MSASSFDMLQVAAHAADAKKAGDIEALDLTKLSDVTDYFLICTATNRPMLDAVVDEVIERVRINCAAKPAHTEGRAGGGWVLLDYGSLVVHVFMPEVRDYYRLEQLWGDAPRVELGLEDAPATDEVEAH